MIGEVMVVPVMVVEVLAANNVPATKEVDKEVVAMIGKSELIIYN